MSYDVAAVRTAEFPWADRGDVLYMNHASTGPLPVRTVEATNAFTALRAEPAGLTDEAQFAVLQRAREHCASLIGAEPGEIALMGNTSYGINLAARTLALGPGDVVVVPDREFPANMYPWLALERTGVRVERVPVRGRLLDEDAFLTALDQPGVRAASVSWVSFETGCRADLARLGGACRERGIVFVVDAIQGLGAATLNTSVLPVDILACGGQKWLLSPWGSGFAYVRRALVARLEPLDIGWMSVHGGRRFSTLMEYDSTFLDDARRFEVGTLPVQDFAGLVSSVNLLLELGPDAVASHVAHLVGLITTWAEAHPGVSLVTPADPARRAGIASVVLREPEEAFRRLRERGIVASLREGAIRLSPYLYNTPDDIVRVIEVLDSVA